MELELFLWGLFSHCNYFFPLENPTSRCGQVLIHCVSSLSCLWCCLAVQGLRGHFRNGNVSVKAINTTKPSVWRKISCCCSYTDCSKSLFIWGVTKTVEQKYNPQNQRVKAFLKSMVGFGESWSTLFNPWSFPMDTLILFTDLGVFLLQEWFLMKKIRRSETWAIRSMLSICSSVTGWGITGRFLIQEMQSMYGYSNMYHIYLIFVSCLPSCALNYFKCATVLLFSKLYCWCYKYCNCQKRCYNCLWYHWKLGC